MLGPPGWITTLSFSSSKKPMPLAAISPIWLLPASQPSWRLTVWVLAWAKPPAGNSPAAAKPVAAAPDLSNERRRSLLMWRMATFPSVGGDFPAPTLLTKGALEKNIFSRGALPFRHRPPEGQNAMHAAVLRYFDHVARHGSIRKAADALSVASSAVNRQILRLEDELGVALFERGRGGVRPTAAGELLLRHVRETQNEYQRVCAEIASLSGAISGNVRIIALESILARFLPDIVAE